MTAEHFVKKNPKIKTGTQQITHKATYGKDLCRFTAMKGVQEC
jgi:hypothetical protein